MRWLQTKSRRRIVYQRCTLHVRTSCGTHLHSWHKRLVLRSSKQGRGLLEHVLSRGCMCVIRSTLHHHSTLGGGVPFFWLCALCLWISPRPTPRWHSDKSLISHLVLVLDIAGRSNGSNAPWSSEIWRRKSLVLFECKVISISVTDGWLRPVRAWISAMCACTHVFVFFFCVGVSAFVGEGGGRRKKNRKSEGRKKCSVCGWYLRFFQSRKKKTIIQTKQQEMKFSRMSLCHLPRFQPTPWKHKHKKKS